MLIGRPPFQASGPENNNNAVDIMKRIKGGEFSMDSPEWSRVSDEAKKIIQGITILPES